MSSLKMRPLAIAAICATSALMLNACSSIGAVWDHFTNDNDPALREPTGYYDHADAHEYVDPLKVPNALNAPLVDHSLDIPALSPSAGSKALVGEKMDVRAPIVAQTNEYGVQILNQNGGAVVWFQPYNKLHIDNETQAWTALNEALSYLKIKTKSQDGANYSLTTAAAAYNAAGEPYDADSQEEDALKYMQNYQVDVGLSNAPGYGQAAYQRQVGYFVRLLDSKTLTSGDSDINETLNDVQKNSFSVGFANTLIKALADKSQQAEIIPDYVNVTLGRDNNNQDAIIVAAPYQSTWNVLHGVLSSYSFKINEYSISSSMYKVTHDDEDANYYHSLGIDAINLNGADYIVRIGVSGPNKSVITFYDSDDKPLKGAAVAAIYPGFSQAIAKEFATYRGNPKAYVAKLEKQE